MGILNTVAGAVFIGIPAIVISYTLGFVALAAVVVSIYLIIRGDFGDGPLSNQQISRGWTTNKVRLVGQAVFLPSWISVPAFFALLLVLSPDDGSPPTWDAYSTLFISCFKGWTILTIDCLMALVIGLAIYMAHAALNDFTKYHRVNTNRSPDSTMMERSVRRLKQSFVAHACTVFLALSVAALSLLWLNVLFYASNWGFFIRHGTVYDFFTCFGYTVCYIFNLCQALLMSCGILLGAVSSLVALYYLVTSSLSLYNSKKRTKGDIDMVHQSALGLVLLIILSLGSFRSFTFKLSCQDMYWRMVEVTIWLNKPGHENQTISWVVFSNRTGNWNATHEAWRPAPFTNFGINTLDEEFKCTWTSGYQYLPFIWCGMAVALFYFAALQTYKLWSRRKALKEGRAYTAMGSGA